MKLACIIPVRNMAHAVGRAIDSAFEAGCDDVVVVDDASTDATPEVLAGYGSRITVWRWPQKTNDWVFAQRVVWDTTEADHYTWLGADDVLLPSFGDAIREHADSPVIFGAYAVVSPAGEYMWAISQDVTHATHLTPEEMRARVQSNRNATETGSASTLRRDVARWLWASGFSAMGPHADSIGYATAACLFGCTLLPIVGSAYTHTETSYARDPNKTAERFIQDGRTCRDWMRSVGLDEATTRALALKRCSVAW